MSDRADLGAVFDEHVASEFETKDIHPGARRCGGSTSTTSSATRRRTAVLHPISRTVSADRVIDEFVLEFAHDAEIPFMLPGVAPTGRRGMRRQSPWDARALYGGIADLLLGGGSEHHVTRRAV